MSDEHIVHIKYIGKDINELFYNQVSDWINAVEYNNQGVATSGKLTGKMLGHTIDWVTTKSDIPEHVFIKFASKDDKIMWILKYG